MVERKDHGDEVIAHEFDYSIKNQARKGIKICHLLLPDKCNEDYTVGAVSAGDR